jgi:hypothetical protein
MPNVINGRGRVFTIQKIMAFLDVSEIISCRYYIADRKQKGGKFYVR